ncbi:GDP-mannose 4,6-dehydratase [Paenibacillus ihumii]|uniref:GDP-mannose 4,6-dehydratase n=1 Tax=Paenibacillus ihumii TaxID=687436 RepID=UPI0006D860A4|nr:GDP-mannose 4,6-dehydratase [Paenibacillus ihumii]
MKVLITGGAGFIGSNLVDRLLAEDHKVIVIDNLNEFYDPELKKNNIISHQAHKNYKFYNADITDSSHIKGIFTKEIPTHIVHLAAWAGVRPSIHNPILYENVNVLGTLNLLEICKEMNIVNFVFASSSSVYGTNSKVPFSENDPINQPISPYAVTKRTGELHCYTYSNLYNIPISCLRFFTVYGPRQRPEMAIHKFTRMIDRGQKLTMFGDGNTKRDYTYIDDIVEGILGVLQRPKNFEIYNIGNSSTVELRQLIQLLENGLSKKANIEILDEQPGDVPITYSDITKLNKLSGFEPKTSIESGVESFLKWYVDNRELLLRIT